MASETADRGDFSRARRPEQKQQRESAILEAARTLAVREGIRAVSLADIAGEIGMHKTALLRYFESREDIYLRIGVESWRDWAGALVQELVELNEGDVEGVSEAFARTLHDRPLLCDFLAHLSLHLERNVSAQALLSSRSAALAASDAIAEAVCATVPDVDRADVRDLIGGVTALAASAWQAANPPPAAEPVFREHPEIAQCGAEFYPKIARFVATYLRGMRALRTDR